MLSQRKGGIPGGRPGGSTILPSTLSSAGPAVSTGRGFSLVTLVAILALFTSANWYITTQLSPSSLGFPDACDCEALLGKPLVLDEGKYKEMNGAVNLPAGGDEEEDSAGSNLRRRRSKKTRERAKEEEEVEEEENAEEEGNDDADGGSTEEEEGEDVAAPKEQPTEVQPNVKPEEPAKKADDALKAADPAAQPQAQAQTQTQPPPPTEAVAFNGRPIIQEPTLSDLLGKDTLGGIEEPLPFPSKMPLPEPGSPEHAKQLAVWAPPSPATFGKPLPKTADGKVDLTKRRRLFFTISPGHSGTMFLARALKCGVNVTAEHEEDPATVGFPAILRRGLKATYQARQAEKLSAFLEWVEGTVEQGAAAYADISHMMIKSWGDVVFDWLLSTEENRQRFEINVIILRRWLPHVLRSFLLVDVWKPDSMLSYNGGEYTVHHRNFALLPPIKPYNEEDSVDLVLGYLVDGKLQVERFKKKYEKYTYNSPFLSSSGAEDAANSGEGGVTKCLRFYDVRAEDLFSKNGVKRFLKAVGLQGIPQKLAVIANARPVNQHVSWKAPELIYNVSSQVWIARAQLFLERYREKGIALPPMPSLINMVPCKSLGITRQQVLQANRLEIDLAMQQYKDQSKRPPTVSPTYGLKDHLARPDYPGRRVIEDQLLGPDILGSGFSGLPDWSSSSGSEPAVTGKTATSQIVVVPSSYIGNYASTVGSVLLEEAEGANIDNDDTTMCPEPYKRYTKEEALKIIADAGPLPKNRLPVSAAVWETNRAVEVDIFNRKKDYLDLNEEFMGRVREQQQKAKEGVKNYV
jgi:hypothetical protein